MFVFMTWLNIISKDHDKWISFVKSFGEKEFAEDIVQEMYLKLHKMDQAVRNSEDKRFAENYTTESRVLKDGKSNSSYIWLVLHSVFIDHKKQETKTTKISLEDVQLVSDEQGDNESLWLKFTNEIEKEKETWHKYDRILFDLYSKKGLSMRDISTGAGIDLRSIWNTLNNCKQRLRKFENQYKSIQNG